MRWGKPEQEQSLARSIRALKHLATSSVGVHVLPSQAGDQTMTDAEDPLVAEVLLGPKPTTAPNCNGQRVPHLNFVCDHSGVNPICGVRFKATNSFDTDITEECRRAGQLAGAAGYRPIPEPADAMRWALAAVLAWWPLLWPERGDLFQAATPDLQTLKVHELSHALVSLPDLAK